MKFPNIGNTRVYSIRIDEAYIQYRDMKEAGAIELNNPDTVYLLLRYLLDAMDSDERTKFLALLPGGSEPINSTRETISTQDSYRTNTPTAHRIASALEACDWSGMPIGNKEILKAAVVCLRGVDPASERSEGNISPSAIAAISPVQVSVPIDESPERSEGIHIQNENDPEEGTYQRHIGHRIKIPRSLNKQEKTMLHTYFTAIHEGRDPHNWPNRQMYEYCLSMLELYTDESLKLACNFRP